MEQQDNTMYFDFLYLLMLENFIKRYGQITTGNLQEFLANMNENDKNIIYKLPLFFEKVSNYNLLPKKQNNVDSDLEYYNFKFNNKYYQIGMYNTFDFIYYCKQIEPIEIYIDIDAYLHEFSNTIQNKTRVRK